MRRLAFSLLAAGAAWLLSPAHSAAAPKSAESRPAEGVNVSPKEVALDHDGAALLTIPAPGRYSIRARTPTGARIELVDMIAGPLDSSGAAGLRDGRIDALLDKGVYKLRVGAVTGATGAARLSVESFAEAETARPVLTPDTVARGELGDLQQRSYTLELSREAPVHLEAVGRALQDLRLWDADGGLVDLASERTTVETAPGHVMSRLRLDGRAGPGRYRVTAYGGEKLAWSDGSTAAPFLLRLADPAPLAAGVAEGVIGPFGAARYEAPASYDAFRLELPEQAPARLDARRGKAREIATIGKVSRTPVATLRLAGGGEPARIDVAGYEGQKFRLRALRQSNRESFEAAGPHLVSVDVAGEGGDEPPATVLLARIESDGRARVIASDLPRVGAGKAWRAKFNLLGTVSLLFEATRDGPLVLDAKGAPLRASIEPALGTGAPTRPGGQDGARYDLAAGFYLLTLEPLGGRSVVLDLTLGPPGLSAPTPAPEPARASISFGPQTLEGGGSYLILANAAPELIAGPRVVALPAALDQAPLALRQQAGEAVAIPLRLPKEGRVVARDEKGADVRLAFADERLENDHRLVTAKIAPSDTARAIGLIYLPPPPPAAEGGAAAGAGGAKGPRATAGRPVFFDLARDETKSLPFDVAQGGLYRIETLGRLKTALRVGAAVSPNLGEGEANGPGQNGLVTTFLRAGSYRAVVTSKDSSGHLGLSVAPASLAQTAKIVEAGDARATLAPGKGAVAPIEIPRAGAYRLSLAGLSRDWRARLEDADGWPLLPPGSLRRKTLRLAPGAYRLVVSPEDVEARMIARLAPVAPPPALEGHGPHPLPFEAPQNLQWREPQAQGAPRAPDVWRFSLAGDSDVELTIGAGMIGELLQGDGAAVGRVVGDRPFKGRLGAGDYRVEARSLAHDDRLDYEIVLTSPQLQPGAARRVALPATLEFALARESVVDLSSFGGEEAIGALKTAQGETVERLEPRADDWNVALARRLPAGAYRLELEALAATRPTVGGEPEQEAASQENASSDGEEAEDAAVSNGSAAPGGSDAQEAQGEAESGVEVRLSLREEKDGPALAASGETVLTGSGAQRLALPAFPEDSLALVAARSAREAALSIERRGDDGAWRVVGVARGLAPVAAWPARRDGDSWRVTVWPVGGGAEPIAVSARAVERRARPYGAVSFEPEADVGPAICIAKVDAPRAALVDMTAQEGVLAGSAPGQLLRPRRSGALAPQSPTMWLLARDCRARATVAAFDWLGQEVPLDLGAGERAVAPMLDAPRGKTRLWLARSTFAQPAIDAGAGMGVAEGAALALSGAATPQLWNASGGGAMRATLSAIDVETRAPVDGGGAFAALAPPMSAQPVDMAASDAPLALDLAGGLAAFVGKTAVFGDGAAVSRVVHGAPSRVLLVNMTSSPLPARIVRTADASLTLDAARAFRRFFGVAGQLALSLDAQPNDRLIVIGAEATVITGTGRVLRGRDLSLDGPGQILLDYKPGLVAAWIERGGAAPWPQADARRLEPPQRVALDGPAARFVIERSAPVMLAASSGAPALLSFTQDGRRETLAFPAGVEFRHYMAAGAATLELYAPHDGPLGGALDVSAQPVIEAHDGVNDALAVPPGASALFAIEVRRAGEIGVGVRAEPDRVRARLMDAAGKALGEGVNQLVTLPPGRYFLEARVPADGTATTIRVAVAGLSPPPAAAPEEVVAELLAKAGMKKGK